MLSMCSCFCNLSGHSGQCQGVAVPQLRLASDQPRIFTGRVCRSCFDAVRGGGWRLDPEQQEPKRMVRSGRIDGHLMGRRRASA